MAGENTSGSTEQPLDNTAGKERRGLWGAALGWDTRHGMPERGMVWVGKTSEIGWDTFH